MFFSFTFDIDLHYIYGREYRIFLNVSPVARLEPAWNQTQTTWGHVPVYPGAYRNERVPFSVFRLFMSKM